jgi:hypothetical protein
MCAIVCPEAVIEVERDDVAGNIKPISPAKRNKINNLVREPN